MMKPAKRLTFAILVIGVAFLLINLVACITPPSPHAPTPTILSPTPTHSTPTPTIPPTSTPTGSLDFETVAVDSGYDDGKLDLDKLGKEVEVIVATKRKELELINELVGHRHVDKDTTVAESLNRIDFANYFVIGAFRRRHLTGCYDVVIKHIAPKGEQLLIYIHLFERGSGRYKACTDAETTYFHIVKVKRPLTPINAITPIVKLLPVTLTPAPCPPIICG